MAGSFFPPFAACPPDSNGLSDSDYVQLGSYFFYETPAKHEWDDAELACQSYSLDWVDVNDGDRATNLIASGLGKYDGTVGKQVLYN